MKENKVWVVINGERHEGGDVVSVHATREGAREAALQVRPHFDGGWQAVDRDHWENGCDFVVVREYGVRE